MLVRLTCLFLATLPAFTAHAGAPTAAIVQAAYVRETNRGDPRHDKNIQVLSANCGSAKIENEYLCLITYTSTVDQAQPLFNDVAVITETAEGWSLKTGLCRR